MTIIELPQGYYGDLSGMAKMEALGMFAEFDADFKAKHPGTAKYHQPCWREFETREGVGAPFGYEWYMVDAAGLLQRHSARVDSSG